MASGQVASRPAVWAGWADLPLVAWVVPLVLVVLLFVWLRPAGARSGHVRHRPDDRVADRQGRLPFAAPAPSCSSATRSATSAGCSSWPPARAAFASSFWPAGPNRACPAGSCAGPAPSPRRQRPRRPRTRRCAMPARPWPRARSSASSPRACRTADGQTLDLLADLRRGRRLAARPGRPRLSCTSRTAACSACTRASSSARWPAELPSPVSVTLRRAAARRHARRRQARQALQELSAQLRHRPHAAAPAGPSPVRAHGRPPPVPLLLDRLARAPGQDTELRQGLVGAVCLAQLLRPHARRRRRWSASGCRPGAAARWPTSPWPCSARRRSTSTTPPAPDVVQSAIRQCGMQARPHLASASPHKMPLDAGPGVELIYLEDFRRRSPKLAAAARAAWRSSCCPASFLERCVLGLGKHSRRRPGHGHLLQRQHRRSQGRDADARQHRRQRRVDDPGHRPAARATALLGILPFFHSFGYTVTLWVPLQVGASIGLSPQSAPGQGDRRAVPEAPAARSS